MKKKNLYWFSVHHCISYLHCVISNINYCENNLFVETEQFSHTKFCANSTNNFIKEKNDVQCSNILFTYNSLLNAILFRKETHMFIIYGLHLNNVNNILRASGKSTVRESCKLQLLEQTNKKQTKHNQTVVNCGRTIRINMDNNNSNKSRIQM